MQISKLILALAALFIIFSAPAAFSATTHLSPPVVSGATAPADTTVIWYRTDPTNGSENKLFYWELNIRAWLSLNTTMLYASANNVATSDVFSTMDYGAVNWNDPDGAGTTDNEGRGPGMPYTVAVTKVAIGCTSVPGDGNLVIYNYNNNSVVTKATIPDVESARYLVYTKANEAEMPIEFAQGDRILAQFDYVSGAAWRYPQCSFEIRERVEP